MSERGWAPFAEAIPTAAYGGYGMAPGSMQPIAVMSHIMQGYQSTMIDWAEERPAEHQVSAHASISRAGRIVQHVSIYDPAWTAGVVREPTWPGLRSDSSGVPVNPNTYVVHIEHEGFSQLALGTDYIYETRWPALMLEASVRFHAWVFAQLGIVADPLTVIGHYETNSVTRGNDPGSAWSKATVIGMLAVEAQPDRATVLAYLEHATADIDAAVRLLGGA